MTKKLASELKDAHGSCPPAPPMELLQEGLQVRLAVANTRSPHGNKICNPSYHRPGRMLCGILECGVVLNVLDIFWVDSGCYAGVAVFSGV